MRLPSLRSRSNLPPLAGMVLLGLAACSGGGTSRGPGDEGVDGTPQPNLPSNVGPVLRGSLGSGSGRIKNEAIEPDPYSIAALFTAAGLSPPSGNAQSLAGAIDRRGLPTATAAAISGLEFAPPPTWPPASASDGDVLPLPATVVATGYAGAFDPSVPAGGRWTAGWTLALDGTLSRWKFFGGPLAPGTALFQSSQPRANGDCPDGTTPKGRFSERFGALAADETGLFFNQGGDYDICQLPERLAGTPATGGTQPLLTNDNVYELADTTSTRVGNGEASSTDLPAPRGVVLSVEPGTLVFGKPEQSLVVTRGSRLEAAGLPSAPITFTSMQQLEARFDGDSSTAAAGDAGGWGGLVLMGRAPNAGCRKAPCDVNTVPFGRHGGASPDDRSGTLRYVLLRNAGGTDPGTFGVPPFPSLSLLSTGRRTAIDHVQAHGGSDLGVVIDGGSSFLTHTAITAHRFIFSLTAGSGWTGGLQHVLVIPQVDSSAGVEIGGDSRPPFTFPLIANLTVLGAAAETGDFSQALLVRGGSRLQIWNAILAGDFPAGCIDLDDDATFRRASEVGAAPPEIPGPHLLFRNSVVDCTTFNFNENG
ncbi:MAG: hypothetical protein ACT4P0_07035 [Panacagrimonas sp.]